MAITGVRIWDWRCCSKGTTSSYIMNQFWDLMYSMEIIMDNTVLHTESY